MAILLFAVLAFLILRLAKPRLGFSRAAMIAMPCAVAGWLVLSLITNIAWRAR